MAVIRDCFLVDLSDCLGFEVIYCVYLKNIQNQLKKYRRMRIHGVADISDSIVYTSNIIMVLKKMIPKRRKFYIVPNIPKLVVDS